MVAAPCRANASSAVLLPAPIAPVIATAKGALVVVVGALVLFRRLRGCRFVGCSRIHLVADVGGFALDRLLRRC
jgi:hypothetical protein